MSFCLEAVSTFSFYACGVTRAHTDRVAFLSLPAPARSGPCILGMKKTGFTSESGVPGCEKSVSPSLPDFMWEEAEVVCVPSWGRWDTVPHPVLAIVPLPTLIVSKYCSHPWLPQTAQASLRFPKLNSTKTSIWSHVPSRTPSTLDTYTQGR